MAASTWWSPDLYGEFAGVCTWCGHHFPMEYQWFVKNVFDEDSVREFNGEVEASNPLQFEGFDARLAEARNVPSSRAAASPSKPSWTAPR